MTSSFFRLGIVCVLFALVIGGYGVWYADVEAKSASVAKLTSQIQASSETEKRISEARESLSDLSGYENTIQNYFVPESGVVAFIDYLESSGRAFGATTTVSSVSKNAGTSPSLSIALTVTGPFSAVMRTTGVIEYAPYALTLGSYTIQQGGKGVWTASLALTVGSSPAASTTVATSTPSITATSSTSAPTPTP